ncbi:MAG: DNA translocase FtsK 4TM domain-containing protein, partial [Chloroflexota bacterium]|nr:DNA translocase FtsK 4TM domain-containing protein [Chloroflexota bacterium]
MTQKRRTPARRASPRRKTSPGPKLPRIAFPSVGPEVARSIVGIFFLVLGAVTLIALALPGQGALTDWWRDSIAPWFETGRWLLPFLLLGAGWYLEWGPGRNPNSGWGATIGGVAIAFVGFLGAFEILELNWFGTDRGGGRIGRFLAGFLEPLLTSPGAFILCLAIFAIGLMLAFNLRLKQLIGPMTGSARWFGTTAAASMRREPASAGAGPDGASRAGRAGKAAVGAPAENGKG